MPFSDVRYMRWMKEHSGAHPYALAESGLPAATPEDLAATAADILVSHPDAYGYGPLAERLAGAFGVEAARVLVAPSASFVNFLLLAALLEDGGEALVEVPGYEPHVRAAEAAGGRIRHLPRREDAGFLPDPADVAARIGSQTRVVLLTNLHNPSGVLIPEEALREIGEVAERAGATVLVDEVFLSHLLEDGPADASAASASAVGRWRFGKSAVPAGRMQGPFASVGSWTKSHGLGGLRVGWAVADPELVRAAYRVNDSLVVVGSAPADHLMLLALDRMHGYRRRMRARVAENRAIVEAWMAAMPGLACVLPAGGIVCFPRLPEGVGSWPLVRLLLDELGVHIAPGDFFGAPGHVRIGFGGETPALREGLRRIGEGIERVRRGESARSRIVAG